MLCFTLPPGGNAVPLPSLLRANRPASGRFVDIFATRCGVPSDRILPAASGAAALYVLLRGLAAREPHRRAVAVPAWCCPSVPQAVIQAGLEPVLVDVEPSSLGYEPHALREARGRGLLAVILVHFFGLPQPLPAGDWDGIAFLRDCAQDLDHRPDDGLPCFYSFGRGKALNSGHGGALCVPSDGELLRACERALAALPESGADPRAMAAAINLLSRPRLYWAVSRLPGLGLGRTVWEPIRPERISSRYDGVALASLKAYDSHRGFYGRLVRAYGDLISACDGDRVSSPAPAADGRLPHRFPLLVRDAGLREALAREAGRRFGGMTQMYPAPLPELPGAPAGLPRGEAFPGARRVAREILTLPITAGLRRVEGPFLECLARVLEQGGALRRKPVPAVAASWRRVRSVPVNPLEPIPDAAAWEEAEADACEETEAAVREGPRTAVRGDWTAMPAPRNVVEEVPRRDREA